MRRNLGTTGGSRVRGLAVVTAMVSALLAFAAPTPAALAAAADTVIYGINGHGFSDVVELNLTAGTFERIAPAPRETQAADRDPATGRIYFFESTYNGDEFGWFDPADQTTQIVRTYDPLPSVYAKRMAFAPDGTLYMMDTRDRLFTIDAADGDLTLLGPALGLEDGPQGGTGDMAFAPNGTLYIATYQSLYTLDIASRQATLLYSDMVPVEGVGITLWTGLAYCDGMLYASNGEQATARSGMFSIEPSTGAVEFMFYTPYLFNDLTSCPAFEVPNRAPVAADQSVSLAEDTPTALELAASDLDGDALTFSVVSAPAHGTLTGTPPNLTYTPSADYSGVDTLTFHANDGEFDSNVATVSITVNPVNDAPLAEPHAVTTAEDTSIAITLSGSDIEGQALGYTVTSGPANGVLSGTAPELTYTPTADFVGSDSFVFTVNDGDLTSAPATVTIDVTPVDDAPVAVPQSVTTVEDTPVGVVLSGTDVDGDPLSYVVTSGPTHGTLSGSAPQLTYTPDAGFVGADSFTFVAHAGSLQSAAATVSIDVTDGNVAPSADAQSVSTPEDTALALTLGGSDPNGDALTYSVSTQPSHGTLTGTAPNLTYTPATDFAGSDSLTFRVNDGALDSDTATVTIAVTPVNDAPTVTDQAVSTDEDAPVAVTLSGTDVDGDPLAYTVVSGPSNGALSGTLPNLTYTPAAGFFGTDSFTFSASDGSAGSNLGTVTITVAEVAGVPGAPTGLVATPADGSVGLSWSAPVNDGGQPVLDYVVQHRAVGGSWTTVADGVSDATTADVTGLTNYDEYSFRVRAFNASGTGDPTDAVAATPTDGNDPVDTFNRPDGPLSASSAWTITAPQYSDLVIENGHVIGTGDPDGTASTYLTPVGPDVEVTFDALLGDDYNEVSVLLRMNSPNNVLGSYLLQWVTDGLYVRQGTMAGPVLQIWRIATNGRFTLLGEAPLADDRERTLTFGALGSMLYIEEDGEILLSRIDTTDATGDYIALGQANLSGGTPSQIDNLRIAVASNAAPTAASQSLTTAEDTPVGVTLAGSDPDGDALSYSVTTGPAHGVLTGTAPNLTYTPAADYSGTDSFSFRVNDGRVDSAVATVSLAVTPVNDAPVAAPKTAVSVQGAPVGVVLSGSDVDGDALTFQVTTGPSHGVLSGTAPNLTYTPNAGYVGPDTFSYVADDGSTVSPAATVAITVTQGNRPPVAVPRSVTTPENTSVGVVLAGSDPDGDTLTFQVTTGPSHGVLSGTAPNLTYTPNAGYVGADQFTYVANDGSVASAVATVSITVEEVLGDLVTYAASRTGAAREVNLTQGTSRALPNLSFGTHAMDRHPTNGLVYFYEWNTSGRRFASWNPATGTTTVIRTYTPAPGWFLTQMAFAPNGTLYTIDTNAVLRTIDPATGNVTTLGSITGMANGQYGQMGDLAFAADGTAYIVTYGSLYRLDIASRTATLLHTDMLGSPYNMWFGLAICDGTMYGLHIDGLSQRSSVYRIDVATGALTLVHALPTFFTDLTSCSRL